MVKVNIIAVGKVKEKYFLEGILEYSKRLSKYCEFNIIEVAEENYTKTDSSIINVIKEKEGQTPAPHLKGQVFVMAIEGKKLSSEKLAKTIKDLTDNGVGVITFVIGRLLFHFYKY